MEELGQVDTFVLYFTRTIWEELKDFKPNPEHFLIKEDNNVRVKELGRCMPPDITPQDSDLTLVAAAEEVVEEEQTRVVTIVSNDYKLGQFVNQYREHYCNPTIQCLPVPVFLYHLSKSLNPKWKKHAQKSLEDYISYNSKRQREYDLKDSVRWIVQAMADLFREGGNVLGDQLTHSQADLKQVKQIFLGTMVGECRSYLRPVKNYCEKWRDYLEDLPLDLPSPHTVLSDIRRAYIKELESTILVLNEMLIGSNVDPRLDNTLLSRVVKKHLLKFNKTLFEYKLRETGSDITIGTTMTVVHQLASELRDEEALYHSLLFSILYHWKREDMGQAQLVLETSLLALEEHQQSEVVKLQLLGYLLSEELGEEEKQREYYKALKEGGFKDQALELAHYLFLWRFYKEALMLYSQAILLQDYTNTKQVTLVYRQILICEQLMDREKMGVGELYPGIIERAKEAENSDLVNYMVAEKKRNYKRKGIWVEEGMKRQYKNFPSFLKEKMPCLMVQKTNTAVKVLTTQGMFEVQLSAEKLFADLILRPYTYCVVLEKGVEVMIRHARSTSRWVEGLIEVDDLAKVRIEKIV